MILNAILFLVIYFLVGLGVGVLVAVLIPGFYSEDDDGQEVIGVMMFWPFVVIEGIVIIFLAIFDRIVGWLVKPSRRRANHDDQKD